MLPSGMVFRRSNNYGDEHQKLEFYSTSPYIYCKGDPVNMIDPDGKVPFMIPFLKGLAGAAVDVAAQV